MSKLPAAVALGKLGKGHKKKLSEAEINRRRDWMNEINAKKLASKQDHRKAHYESTPVS